MSLFSETKITFTSPLKDQTVPEEQSVTLECELSKPDQKVQWLKNGKEIKPDRKRGILPKVEGTKHILTIPKALLDDTAEYTVKLKDQETKGKLTVEGRLQSSICCARCVVFTVSFHKVVFSCSYKRFIHLLAVYCVVLFYGKTC